MDPRQVNPGQVGQTPAVQYSQMMSAQPPGFYGELPLSSKPDYEAYCNYLESRGWRREQLTLDEVNTTLVTVTGVALGTIGTVIDILIPAGQKASIMGTQQVPRGANARTAHSLRVRLADSVDTEIEFQTKLRMYKEKSSETAIQLARTFYADVANTLNAAVTDAEAVKWKTDQEWYRFKQGVEVNGAEHLKIDIVSPDITIDSDYVKFALDLDLWTRED